MSVTIVFLERSFSSFIYYRFGVIIIFLTVRELSSLCMCVSSRSPRSVLFSKRFLRKIEKRLLKSEEWLAILALNLKFDLIFSNCFFYTSTYFTHQQRNLKLLSCQNYCIYLTYQCSMILVCDKKLFFIFRCAVVNEILISSIFRLIQLGRGILGS
ncbi:Uncharacterised protein [Chlamydia trachomatis]|nr:Uncharacterised protein [Chlamydia trachomatis]